MSVVEAYYNSRDLRRIRPGQSAKGEIQFGLGPLRRAETLTSVQMWVEKGGTWGAANDFNAVPPAVTDEIVISTYAIGGSGLHANKSVLFTFSGGVANTRYRIVARVVTSLGRSFDGLVRLDVIA